MQRISPALVVLVVLLAGCARHDELSIPAGSEVSLEKRDGVTVSGRLVEVQAQEVVLEAPNGSRMRVPRAEIARVKTLVPVAPAAPAPPPAPSADSSSTPGDAQRAAGRAASDAATDRQAAAPAAERVPEYREVTLPAGTVLPIELKTAVASDTSHVEDAVRGALTRTVRHDGTDVLPPGTIVSGHVTEATRSGRVKGRARIAFRFTQIDLPGEGGQSPMRSSTVAREAAATKKQDAAKIGGGAAGGAIIGGIIGGGSGAAKGAAIGGAAGTGVVVATRGKEVRLGPGTVVSVKLTEPLRVLVRR